MHRAGALLLLLLAAAVRAQTPAPTAFFCEAEILCSGGLCNTNTSLACTLAAECPCQCNAQCDAPAPESCMLRDCWAGSCMNISYEAACDTLDSCTDRTCTYVNESTLEATCSATVHLDGCCQSAQDDCTPALWPSGNGTVGACELVVCENYMAEFANGTCGTINETAFGCCVTDDDCYDPAFPCDVRTCENVSTANE